jgi:hypothetical protein
VGEVRVYAADGTTNIANATYLDTTKSIVSPEYDGYNFLIPNLWDGNSATFCHTGNTAGTGSSYPYIKLYFKTPMRVSRIVVVNRENVAQYRLIDCLLEAFSDDCVTRVGSALTLTDAAEQTLTLPFVPVSVATSGYVFVDDVDVALTLENTSSVTTRASPQGLDKSAIVVPSGTFLDLSTNSALDFTHTSSAFSFGGWFYMTQYGSLMSNQTATPSIKGFDLKMTGASGMTQLESYASGTATSTSTFTFPFHQWCHVWCMYTASDRTMKVYVNATLVRTLVLPASSFSSGASWKILKNARFGASTGGNVADIRFYTSSAVAASVAMSEIKYLWSMDPTPYLSTAQSYSGGSAMNFLGTGTVDATTWPSLQVAGLDLTQDYTIENFVYLTAEGFNPLITICRSTDQNAYEWMYCGFNPWDNKNTSMMVYSGGTSPTIPKMVVNTWTHMSVTFKQSNRTFYAGINGTVGSIALTGNTPLVAAPIDFFWRRDYTPQNNRGWMDSLRVSQAALYTANYTVPNPAGWVVGGSTLFVEAFSLANVSGTSQNCTQYGVSNGSIILTTTGTTAPITYLWNDGSTSVTRSGLAPGSYSVTMTDAIGRIATTSFTITQPNPPIVATTSATSTTGGLSNGSASVSASGGVSGTFTYSWKRGTSATVVSTASSISSQPAGMYVCTISTAGTPTVEKRIAIQPVLACSNVTSISVSLAWQTIPDAILYRVSTIDRAINTPAIPGTSYTLYGLTHSKSYTLMLFSSSNGTNFIPNTDCTITFTTAAANDTSSMTTVLQNLKSTSGANASFALQTLDTTSFNIIKDNLSNVAASGDKLTFNKKNSAGSVEAAFSVTFARPGATLTLAAPTKGSLSAASNVLLDFKTGVSNQSAVQLSVGGSNVDVAFDEATNKIVVGGVTRSVGDEFEVNGQLCTVEEI